jgi:hypothetical protein
MSRDEMWDLRSLEIWWFPANANDGAVIMDYQKDSVY